MAHQNKGPIGGGLLANAEMVAGLRACADWLEAHPELRRAEHAFVTFGYAITQDARERLVELAVALGSRAQERRTGYSDDVRIEGNFGPVQVYASAKKSLLMDARPVPEPEPILPRTERAA